MVALVPGLLTGALLERLRTVRGDAELRESRRSSAGHLEEGDATITSQAAALAKMVLHPQNPA